MYVSSQSEMLLQKALQYLADNKVINAVEVFGAQEYEESLSPNMFSLQIRTDHFKFGS